MGGGKWISLAYFTEFTLSTRVLVLDPIGWVVIYFLPTQIFWKTLRRHLDNFPLVDAQTTLSRNSPISGSA